MYYNLWAIVSGIVCMWLGLMIGSGDKFADVGIFLVGVFLLCLGWFYKSKRQKVKLNNEATE